MEEHLVTLVCPLRDFSFLFVPLDWLLFSDYGALSLRPWRSLTSDLPSLFSQNSADLLGCKAPGVNPISRPSTKSSLPIFPCPTLYASHLKFCLWRGVLERWNATRLPYPYHIPGFWCNLGLALPDAAIAVVRDAFSRFPVSPDTCLARGA
jgi:hypothetical protein